MASTSSIVIFKASARVRIPSSSECPIFFDICGVQVTEQWQHAAKLMQAAAEGGDLQAVVDQFERLLAPKNLLDLGSKP